MLSVVVIDAIAELLVWGERLVDGVHETGETLQVRGAFHHAFSASAQIFGMLEENVSGAGQITEHLLLEGRNVTNIAETECRHLRCVGHDDVAMRVS